MQPIIDALNGQMLAFQQSNLAHLQAFQARYSEALGMIDSRALGGALAGTLLRSDNSSEYANLNTAVRTPSTIEHVPYPPAAK